MPLKKFNNDNIWKAYKYAAAGLTNKDIAIEIGVDVVTFNRWKKKYPVLKNALDAGYDSKGVADTNSLESFVYGKLDEELQDYFDYLNEEVDFCANNKLTVEAKQMLFLQMWYDNDFNISEALRKTNIPLPSYHRWLKEDDMFISLHNQMLIIRKDFVEAATMRLIKQGDSHVTAKVNAALNKDRGYGNQVDVNHGGKLGIQVGVDLTTLDLPEPVLLQVLDAIREKEQQAEVLSVTDV